MRNKIQMPSSDEKFNTVLSKNTFCFFNEELYEIRLGGLTKGFKN